MSNITQLAAIFFPPGKIKAPVIRVAASPAAAAQPASLESERMEGEVPADWNWKNWTHSFTEDAFKGNWGDWVFFDTEGKVTKQFRGKVSSAEDN